MSGVAGRCRSLAATCLVARFLPGKRKNRDSRGRGKLGGAPAEPFPALLDEVPGLHVNLKRYIIIMLV